MTEFRTQSLERGTRVARERTRRAGRRTRATSGVFNSRAKGKGGHGMRGVSRSALGLIVAFTLALMGVGGFGLVSSHSAVSAAGANTLEIFDWWTAGGERDAMLAMFKVFKQKYPTVN